MTDIEEKDRYYKFCDTCRSTWDESNYDKMGPSQVEQVVRYMIPRDNRPSETSIKGISKNWNSKKSDNIYYHLLRVIPKLFIAGLHCETPTDDQGFPTSGHSFKTRYLSKRLEEPYLELVRLEKVIEEERHNNHYEKMIKLEQKVSELKLKKKDLKKEIKTLKYDIDFKDDKLKNSISKKMYEGLQKENEALKKLLDKQ